MTMKKYNFQGPALARTAELLPAGAMRMAMLLDAIHQADRAEDHYWRLLFRYDYAGQATFHDDPPKAMATASEFAAIFEEHPDVLGEGGPLMYLMVTEMGIDPMAAMPEISRSHWEAAMKRFHTLVERYGIGERTWQGQAARFLAYVDPQEASAAFERFLAAPRDDLSDCPACEASNSVWFCLMNGDKERADQLAAPILDGSLACGDVPQSTWEAYLTHHMDRSEWMAAAPLAEDLYQKGDRDRSDLSYTGAILRCWAHTDPDRAGKLLEQRLDWTHAMWDKRKLYDFYKGAWACCHQLAVRTDRALLRLPRSFPLWQEDGAYAPQALADWFWEQAAELAARFDRRNGTDWFARDLRRAADSEA